MLLICCQETDRTEWVEYASGRVAFSIVAAKRRRQAEDQRDKADSSRSQEGGTCQETDSSRSQEGGTYQETDSSRSQEGGTCQDGGTCQESNGRERWNGQVVWGEDDHERDWGEEEKEEEGKEEEVWFTIKVKPTPSACRAQFDDLEITSDGQSLEPLKLRQRLPRLGSLLGNSSSGLHLTAHVARGQ